MKLKFLYFFNSFEIYCKYLFMFEDFYGFMFIVVYLGGVKGVGERNREVINSLMYFLVM